MVRNALLLLFAFVGLGLAAAVVAHKMDPRVYVASDVEQLLGYAPMAQLPDFDEVSDEVAAEHLLRLAAGIEYAAKDGDLTSCVFTGTGPGVGVTTIVTRVKEMLAALGKEAVLMDAAGPVPAARLPGIELQRSPRGSSLMPHVRDATASECQGLMLTDTAPLTVSAEAEYMARRADCTILVIESGVTTRAQLRAAATSLQRLNPATVGFVLNRVSLANADESFRNSVSEVERHLRAQGRTAARTVAQSPRIVPESSHIEWASATVAATHAGRPPAAADRTGISAEHCAGISSVCGARIAACARSSRKARCNGCAAACAQANTRAQANGGAEATTRVMDRDVAGPATAGRDPPVADGTTSPVAGGCAWACRTCGDAAAGTAWRRLAFRGCA